MSHAATNWAIRQKGLKPATKIVLWHLADCHNGHTGQCNPRQERLAAECEMSRSTLNLHLSKLEDLGLIRRNAEVDPGSKRQRPTSYILAFDAAESFSEGGAEAVSENRTRTLDVVPPCPEIGHGNVRKQDTEPCPKNAESRVLKSDTIENPGKEPGIEASEQCASEKVDEGQTQDLGVDEVLADLLSAVGLSSRSLSAYWLPNAAAPWLLRWMKELSPEEIVATGRASRQRYDTPPNGPKALDRAMAAVIAAKKSAAEPMQPEQGRARGAAAETDEAKSARWRQIAARHEAADKAEAERKAREANG